LLLKTDTNLLAGVRSQEQEFRRRKAKGMKAISDCEMIRRILVVDFAF
jgi:hypothetical protein